MKTILSLLFMAASMYAQTTMKVCAVDAEYKPIAGKCFVVPAPVLASFEALVAEQNAATAGAIGTPPQPPKYASVWDMIVKHFVATLVLPVLDRYPTPAVAAAKAAAEAAARQADAAKYAALQ